MWNPPTQKKTINHDTMCNCTILPKGNILNSPAAFKRVSPAGQNVLISDCEVNIVIFGWSYTLCVEWIFKTFVPHLSFAFTCFPQFICSSCSAPLVMQMLPPCRGGNRAGPGKFRMDRTNTNWLRLTGSQLHHPTLLGQSLGYFYLSCVIFFIYFF